jgi:outer membrane protein OmpA-like peptidoglycan-associated protein
MLLLVLAPLRAGAQNTGFSLDRLSPAPAGDAFFVTASPEVDGDRRLFAGTMTEFAQAPLVLRSPDGSREFGRIVSARLNLRLQVAFSLASRYLLDLEVPFALVNQGSSPISPRGTRFASPDGLAAGDLRLGGRTQLLRLPGDRLRLAAAAALWLPTGRRAEYTGDGTVRAMAMAVAGGVVGRHFAWAGNLGFHARAERVVAGNLVAKELFLSGAGGLLAARGRVLLGPELWASGPITGRADFLAARTTAAEVLLGLHYRARTVRFGVGTGRGLTVAMGTPGTRLVARFTYAPRDPEPLPPPPARPVPPPRDRDGDGIPDDDDACPLVPGVRQDDPRKNGCPLDRDGDAITDGEDACPLVPGVRDPDPKKNGCPSDRDGDGIVDAEDACPRERGPRDSDPEKNGCPTLVRVTEREIVILKQIHFEFNKARIMPDSSELLAQIAQVLKEHPEIRRVSIEGHTDALGSTVFNLRLSQQRADAVRTWLMDSGIASDRLTATGHGKTRPVSDNRTEEGRERNRRVEFHIVPEGGTP